MKTQTPKLKTSPDVRQHYAENQAAASALLGIPARTVRAAKAAGCKAFVGSRVVLTELEAWLRSHPEVRAEDFQAEATAEAKLLHEVSKAQHMRERYRQFRRRHIDAAQVRATVTACYRAAQATFLAIPPALAGRLALMTDAVEIEQLLREQILAGMTAVNSGPWPDITAEK